MKRIPGGLTRPDAWTVRATCFNRDRLVPPEPPAYSCAARFALPLAGNVTLVGGLPGEDGCEARCSADGACKAYTWFAHNETCALATAVFGEGGRAPFGPAWWASSSCVHVARLGGQDTIMQYQGSRIYCRPGLAGDMVRIYIDFIGFSETGSYSQCQLCPEHR